MKTNVEGMQVIIQTLIAACIILGQLMSYIGCLSNLVSTEARLIEHASNPLLLGLTSIDSEAALQQQLKQMASVRSLSIYVLAIVFHNELL